jgi:hypothetical protein
MKRKQELWQQDPSEPDLWLGENGVLVNTAALEERAYYAEIVKVFAPPVAPHIGETTRETFGEHARQLCG